jgi:threonine/homoserine/homoserine lactone efflux protein
MPPILTSAIPAGILFAFVMTITPGPNNTMLLASGLNFGLRRTVPHVLGISSGVAVMMMSTGLGLGALISQMPILLDVLEAASAAYLLYLAWRIATAGEIRRGQANARPMTFLEGAAFQWINPKAWMMTLSAAATIHLSTDGRLGTLIMAAIFIVVGLPCIVLWAAFGQALSRFLADARVRRLFNIGMAFLLIASLYPLFAQLSMHM